ncbi:hypothetical protein NKJ23_34290 [Mesorhizobium sp. M0184]|uniref:hypothetical protein n=1 Tax=Mesorhizobium sp. M0184 TaxID=2956906 RepID=UPI00333D0DF3
MPYKIHTVLTDNGIQFTISGAGGSAVPLIKEAMVAGLMTSNTPVHGPLSITERHRQAPF